MDLPEWGRPPHLFWTRCFTGGLQPAPAQERMRWPSEAKVRLRWERSKPRSLKTRLGTPELRLPEDGAGQSQPSLFECYRWSEKARVLAFAEMWNSPAMTDAQVSLRVETVQEVIYNSWHRHSTLGCRTPAECDEQLTPTRTAA